MNLRDELSDRERSSDLEQADKADVNLEGPSDPPCGDDEDAGDSYTDPE